MVPQLGKRGIPVEITPFQYKYTLDKLEKLTGCQASLRMKTNTEDKSENPYITDNGNYIVDCKFISGIQSSELKTIADSIKMMTGVVEHGLFLNMCDSVIVATSNGTIDVMQRY